MPISPLSGEAGPRPCIGLPSVPNEEKTGIALRNMPYPYRAMLAICSDLDETADRHVYWRIIQFLNTTQSTTMGPGVGLETGNSIYFDMREGFAYWTTDDAGRAMIRDLIRSGHIDCLHSFGDSATTRSHAARALDELSRNGCWIQVWVDHAVAPTNFIADIMDGHGDEAGHPAYHADLTTAYGIRYVWRGLVTSVVGQEVPARLSGLWTLRHPIRSARTVSKEAVKQLLARRGHTKFGPHAGNRVLQTTALRDGWAVYEFLRANPYWGGVASGDTGRDIGAVLRPGMLHRLVRRGGVCLLYTHLGKCSSPDRPFGPEAVAGLRRLADEYQRGRILVTTSLRCLRYVTVRQQISWTVRKDAVGIVIEISTNQSDPRLHRISANDMEGLTFYVPVGVTARIEVDGSPVPSIQTNFRDETGRSSIMLPWSRLPFPPI